MHSNTQSVRLNKILIIEQLFKQIHILLIKKSKVTRMFDYLSTAYTTRNIGSNNKYRRKI